MDSLDSESGQYHSIQRKMHDKKDSFMSFDTIEEWKKEDNKNTKTSTSSIYVPVPLETLALAPNVTFVYR